MPFQQKFNFDKLAWSKEVTTTKNIIKMEWIEDNNV